jgi:hypothetical protein
MPHRQSLFSRGVDQWYNLEQSPCPMPDNAIRARTTGNKWSLLFNSLMAKTQRWRPVYKRVLEVCLFSDFDHHITVVKSNDFTKCSIKYWRKLHNRLFRTAYPSPSPTITVIKSRIRGMWHACQRWQIHKKYWSENQKENGHLGDLGADRNILLKLITKYIGYEGVGWIHLAQDRPVAGFCEDCKEH